MEIFTESARETQRAGARFASKLKGGEVVGLVGELGSGKTTFVQGLAEGLGVKGRVISPSFILMRQYKVKSSKLKVKNLYHIDLYRLEEDVEKEFRNLGVEDFWGKRDNIVVVEWAERVKGLLPKDTIWLHFEVLGGDKRSLTLTCARTKRKIEISELS